jgi:hypothetical protein
MSQKRSSVKAIVSFIGIDYYLLRQSGEDNVDKFYVCGLLVMVIFLISFCSVYYAFDLMFHQWYAEVLLATFFSLTFLTIYLLLIQTFSKEGLPAGYKTSFFTTSNIARICFVVMISFLIAQPVRIYLMRERLDTDITRYRADLYADFAKKNANLYRGDLLKLNQRANVFGHLNSGGVANGLKLNNAREIAAIRQRIVEDNAVAYGKIASSDFFLKRIAFVKRYPVSWLICLGVMIIFGLPVLLIYSISGDSRYYTAKKNFDHNFIQSHYELFKRDYERTFLTRYQHQTRFYENYADAPFNWIRQTEPVHGSKADFRKEQGLE